MPYLFSRHPPKLLLVSTGNVSNDVLIRLILENLSAVETARIQFDFVELSRTALTVHS